MDVDLRADAQGQQAENGVGEATPHPDVVLELTDVVGCLEHRSGDHLGNLVPDVGGRGGDDDVKQLTTVLVVVHEPAVQVTGVPPEAEDQVLSREVGGGSQISQTDPAKVAALALTCLADRGLLIGLEGLTDVRQPRNGYGLAELTLVDLLGAVKAHARRHDPRVVATERVRSVVAHGHEAERLVADVQLTSGRRTLSVVVGSEEPDLLELVARGADKGGAAVVRLHDPLPVRDNVHRLDQRVVVGEQAVLCVGVELPLTLDEVRTALG